MNCSDKHSSLLWTFASYKENEVLWIRLQVFVSSFVAMSNILGSGKEVYIILKY